MEEFGDMKEHVVRVYSELQETADYPIPRDIYTSKRNLDKDDESTPHSTEDDVCSDLPGDSDDSNKDNTENLKDISLHNKIREGTPISQDLKDFDDRVRDEGHKEKISDEDIAKYREKVTIASKAELTKYEVIFCTCSIAMAKRMTEALGDKIAQVIIDECGMCKEPECFIPLVAFNKVERIVLIGDHKQLQPIVSNRKAQDFGLGRSLFERYADRAIMLTDQYRMVRMCGLYDAKKEFLDFSCFTSLRNCMGGLMHKSPKWLQIRFH